MDIFRHFNFCHNGRNSFCFDNRIFERIGKKSTWENSIAFCFHQYAILVHNTKREKISLFLFLILFNLFYDYAKLQNYKFLNYLQYFCETFFQMNIMYLCICNGNQIVEVENKSIWIAHANPYMTRTVVNFSIN